jgi:hypothetical protein
VHGPVAEPERQPQWTTRQGQCGAEARPGAATDHYPRSQHHLTAPQRREVRELWTKRMPRRSPHQLRRDLHGSNKIAAARPTAYTRAAASMRTPQYAARQVRPASSRTRSCLAPALSGTASVISGAAHDFSCALAMPLTAVPTELLRCEAGFRTPILSYRASARSAPVDPSKGRRRSDSVGTDVPTERDIGKSFEFGHVAIIPSGPYEGSYHVWRVI